MKIKTEKDLFRHINNVFSKGQRFSGPRTKIKFLGRGIMSCRGDYRYLNGTPGIRVCSLKDKTKQLKNIPLFPQIIIELYNEYQKDRNCLNPINTKFEEITRKANLTDFPNLTRDESYYVAFVKELDKRSTKKRRRRP